MTLAEKLNAEAVLMQTIAKAVEAAMEEGLGQNAVKAILERMTAVVEEGDD